jgi:hypothetical protein
MTLLSEQLERIQWVLQDLDTGADRLGDLAQAQQEALATLARRDFFPAIHWLQATAHQAVYTLPAPTVTVQTVLYNEQTLSYVSEAALTRLERQGRQGTAFEGMTGEPRFWTLDHQRPHTFRVVPRPLRTGSTTPIFPSPLVLPLVDNFVVFVSEDVSADVDDLEDTMPTTLDWEDWLVYETVRAVAARETEAQNLPVALRAGQLADLWLARIQEG